MENTRTQKSYKAEINSALEDTFLRETLDAFAVAYRANRATVFSGMDEKALIAEISGARDRALKDIEGLYLQFKTEAEKRGVIVHRAKNAAEANDHICRIAEEHGCARIVKSKSMTSEETRLNSEMLRRGFDVAETDLGEWIIQLRQENPTHMVMPAIHLSRSQVADVFGKATGRAQDADIEKLVRVAREELREKFFTADMGISGANFAVAESGTIGLCTNEGNARLVTTVPRVHVALCGLDKLTPTLHDALRILRVLPRSATGQAATSYVTWISGATECLAAPAQRKIMHVIFLDNGRTELAKDPVCGEALRCVRCGACANVCPVYRLVGGHRMGHIYIGAIGLILTYFFHGRDHARHLVQNCIQCGACKNACAAGINLPAIIQEIRSRVNEEEGSPLPSRLLGQVMSNRKLFHTLLRFGKWAQKPVTGTTRYVRHLPEIFAAGQNFRALPAIADTPFRDRWPHLANGVSKGTLTVGLFAGCAQDFIYPEQLEAAVTLFKAKGCRVVFPPEQTCCGLPLTTMGERARARHMAQANIAAFEHSGCEYIVTLCASCASHMKDGYPLLLRDGATPHPGLDSFTGRITDFSSFLVNTLGYGEKDFTNTGDSAGYHSPCHLCRGLNVTEEPRALLRAAGRYVPTEEEDVCCGFGGTYSVKFPEISSRLLGKKLERYEAAQAGRLVTDCPGCVIQLRGGEERGNRAVSVEHMAEFLAARLKTENG